MSESSPDTSVTATRPLLFASDSSSPFVDYVLELVAGLWGIELRRADGAVDVYHGTDECRPCAFRIPLVEAYSSDDVPRVPTEGMEEGVFPFDLFAATRYWLADEGNDRLAGRGYDRHDRLLGSGSAQELAGVVELPVVNAYLLVLRMWLEARCGARPRLHLPPGKRCAVVLSHDVDRPLDPLDVAPTLGLAARSLARYGRLTSVWSAAVALGKAAAALRADRGGRHWVFDEVASEEERRGFRSTFFFASTSRFARCGSYFDVEYDLRHPRFRGVLRDLVARGFEVGLHVGYRAGTDAARVREEKAVVEEVAGAEVTGSRRHYWRLGRRPWPALEAHAAAGLRHDSSTSFAEARGYRLGIAFPFRPWNPDVQRAIDCVEVPTMLMDGSFFYKRGQRVDDALERTAQMLETLKRYEGVAAIDWHQETSVPLSGRFRDWGEGYLRLLDLLAGDSEIEVLTCAAAARLFDRAN
jgi:hypothetical protein